MYILDNFFNNPPILNNFFERKLKLPKDINFNLYGAIGVGKSALIVNYISKLPKYSYLYIDMLDPQFILEEFTLRDLNEFIKYENISTVVIDHYIEGFLDEIPDVKQFITVTQNRSNLIENSYKLYPLDFEEFFSLSKANSISSSFSQYIKSGSLPSIAINGINSFAPRELFFEKLDDQLGRVLLLLSLFQCKVTTTHQAFQVAKSNFNISKDKFYSSTKELISKELIYQIETYEKSIGKKVIFYDFALAKYLNKNLNYTNTFDALVAIALIKHNIKIKATLNPLGYITQERELILIAPFEEEDNIWGKIQKNFGFYSKLKPKKVTIITNSNNYNFTIKNIDFNAIPFYEWATTLEA